MKEVYLHIGMHKTATTVLQSFFALNQDALGRNGINYPHFEFMQKKDHRRLVMSFYPNNKTPYCEAFEGIKGPVEEWETFLNTDSEDKMLLSSEQFFICSPDIISKIHEITSSFHVKVVCYIRRQDELEESWYNQSIKGFRCSGSMPVMTVGYDTSKYFSYWEDIFGAENMIVRPYEKGQFYNGSIFSDFLYYVFGIESVDEFTLPAQDENVGLHRIVLEYQRLVNCLPLTEKQKNRFNSPLRDVSKELINQKRENMGVFSPEHRSQFLKSNESFYQKLSDTYSASKENSFFSDLSVVSEPWYLYQLTKEDAYFINMFLAEQFTSVFEILLQGIEQGFYSAEKKEVNAAAMLLPGLFDLLAETRKKYLSIERSRSRKMLCRIKKIIGR